MDEDYLKLAVVKLRDKVCRKRKSLETSNWYIYICHKRVYFREKKNKKVNWKKRRFDKLIELQYLTN